MKQAWINLENSILLQNDRNEVSALIQSQKINDFQRKVTISHIERLRLIRLIRVMDPSNLTLDLILEKYRLVANYLMNFAKMNNEHDNDIMNKNHEANRIAKKKK
ncbi:gonadal protein gdl [Sarcoptes scabiei]|nr:gonadal protein gdl [Sarcoptes scabiei]